MLQTLNLQHTFSFGYSIVVSVPVNVFVEV